MIVVDLNVFVKFIFGIVVIVLLLCVICCVLMSV